MSIAFSHNDDAREIVHATIEHLDHVLPGQAPIHDFVHHNTLHGFQHLPFRQALAEFSGLTGIACYLPAAEFRAFYSQGRIDDSDIDAALQQWYGQNDRQANRPTGACGITEAQLHWAALLYDLSPLKPAELRWQLQEGELRPSANRQLWQAVLDALALQMPDWHAEQWLAEGNESVASRRRATAGQVRADLLSRAQNELDTLLDQVGAGLSLRGLLQQLTGIDILEQVRPQLIRWCGSLLDEGMAAWHLPQRCELGLYRAWRQVALLDPGPLFEDLTGWQPMLAELPDDPVDAIVQQLQALAIPGERWPDYLQRLALEIPGWSGLFNWRQTHPNYRAEEGRAAQLADYLALRLILDRAYGDALCRRHWHCPLQLDKLRAHLQKHAAEASVRLALFGAELPEYLAQAGQELLAAGNPSAADWQSLAEGVWLWRCNPLAPQANEGRGVSVFDQGWRLFALCRALGLAPEQVRQAGEAELLQWLALIDVFTEAERSHVWLCAYERHYRQQLLQALHANRGRGRWATRGNRPEAQIVFCMDDREEGIRRHLEELNPAVETLGAAGFFGVPMNYQGLDDHRRTPLCPVVVVPAHDVEERSRSGQDFRLARHRRGERLKQAVADSLHHGVRRHALLSYPVLFASAPLIWANLLLKSFWPKGQESLLGKFGRLLSPDIATRLHFDAEQPNQPATPERPRLGFTDEEQADRIAGFLRNTGLTYGFAELVVLMGHGSISQNNPHLAAYDCGACSGRHGGPNARLFAAMANRPQVRALLVERGISIPADTWFVGAEHNTGNEDLIWYDADALPTERLAALAKFQAQMRHAQQMSAHERCRRLASAPRRPKPKQALRHFLNRTADFSQARPELGHATNASALVGRRSLTQGAFFDRRLFLISYDPTQDPDGKVLEGILLAVGPVGAGINLEYYFSTVNNERLGCGSKVPHNLTGFFAVMEGASSDLRTGLPRQMIEIHEAMRLQIVVEAKIEVLGQIYARQPALQELIGGGWLHVSAIDPDDGAISLFEPGTGFVPWQPLPLELPLRANSPDCYRDETGPVGTMLIEQPAMTGECGR